MQLANFNLYTTLMPNRIGRQPLNKTNAPLNLFPIGLNQNPFYSTNLLNLTQGFVANTQHPTPITPLHNPKQPISVEKAREFLPYLELSQIAYKPTGAPKGWQRLTMATINGVPLHDANSGFDAEIFKNIITQETVIAFRGSENFLTSANDWEDDRLQIQGQITPQTKQAMQLAQAAVNTFGTQLSFTGHSLGGGLAQIAGALVGRKAYGFNSLGMNSNLQRAIGSDKIHQNQHLIHHINLKGEIVTDSDNQRDTDATGGKLLGNVYYADNKSFQPLPFLDSPITRHFLPPLKEALQAILGQSDRTNDTRDILDALVRY